MACTESRAPIPCLTYHRLHSGAGPSDVRYRGLSAAAARFREQMAALAQSGYTTGTPADLLCWRAGTRARPARPLLITFDDGWVSTLELAWPVLQEFGLTASVFVTVDGRAPVFREGGALDRGMTEEEMSLLAARGACLQSHTVTHPALTELACGELRRELTESQERLEALTGRPVVWLACPYGLSSRRVQAATAAVGYAGCAAGAAGGGHLNTPPMRLRRIGVRPSWSGEELLRRLSPSALRTAAAVAMVKRSARGALGYRLSTSVRTSLLRMRSRWEA